MRALLQGFTAGLGTDRTWIITAFADEVLAELIDTDGADEQYAQMMLQAAAILQWVATGEIPETADEFVIAMTAQPAPRELTGAPH